MKLVITSRCTALSTWRWCSRKFMEKQRYKGRDLSQILKYIPISLRTRTWFLSFIIDKTIGIGLNIWWKEIDSYRKEERTIGCHWRRSWSMLSTKRRNSIQNIAKMLINFFLTSGKLSLSKGIKDLLCNKN